MALYAIGDVQGCFDELQQLLKAIRFDIDVDRLWFCGDLINRGPRSLDTLRLIHSLRDNIVTVLGNHDLHLLATYYHHRKAGRKDTIDELLNAPDSEVLLDWLRRQPLLHHDADLDVCMLHAGIHPEWSLDKAKALAVEVETILRSDDHIQFYKHMYGDKPHYWSDDLTGWSRIRFITNILTRIRYFSSDLRVSLNVKGAPGTQPVGQIPWFDIPGRATEDIRIVFGHWSTLTLVERDFQNVYPIDDGCLWGGRLTALRLDGEEFIRSQIDCQQRQQPDTSQP